jgi:ELWxxDGT repeat protein
MTPAPTISLQIISPSSVTEDRSDLRLSFSFFRSGSVEAAMSVNYTVAGSASLASDYTGIPVAGATKTVTFAAGSSYTTVEVAPVADSGFEFNESVELQLAPGRDYSIGSSGPVTGLIINDDRLVDPAGLRQLEIRPGAAGAYPYWLTAVGDRLYFIADDGSQGPELWWSEGGSPVRTNIKLAGSASPSAAITLVSDLNGVVGTNLYFSGYSAGSGTELWRYNSSGAALFKDLLPARWDASDPGSFRGPWALIGVGSSLFFQSEVIRSFIGSDGTIEEELENQLWHSDGTPEGTQPLGLALTRFDVAQLRSQFAVGNTLFFSAWNDTFTDLNLWTSDGTPAGTQPLAILPSHMASVAKAGNRLFFVAGDALNGNELWTSDGTSAGTHMVKDIIPGTSSPGIELGNGTGWGRVQSAALGNTLYFSAEEGSSGRELWKSDGSAAGTVLVADINPGSAGSDPAWFEVIGDTLFFAATNESGGRTLWKSDGTAAGTVQVVPSPAPQGPLQFPEWLTAVGNTLYFVASNSLGLGDTFGRELWKSDGSAAGTVPVADLNPDLGSSYISWPTLVGSTLFFSAYSASSGYELWGLDVGEDLLTPIEVQGDTSLLRRHDGLASVRVGADLTPITSPFGLGPGDGQSEWQMLAAERVNGQNQILWRNNPGQFLHLWNLDLNWNWQSSYGTIALASSAAADLEASFQVDVDGDGFRTGSITINGVNLGGTNLGYALRSGSGAPIQISYPGGNASASNPGNGWIAVAAAPNSSGYALYWRNSSSGQAARWELNAAGAYQAGLLLSASELIQEEGKLNIDLDGDAYTSGSTTINGVNLGQTSLGYALRSGSGAPVQVTYPGGNASASNPGNGWSAVAGAASGSGYAFYWRNSASGQTARWDLNSSGAYTTGTLLSASQLLREEASLNVDLNGDGYTAGPTTINGVNLGSTSQGYALLSGSGVPLQVTYPGGNASASNPGNGWSAVAAAASGSGYAFYWRNSATGQTARWDLNSAATYQSGALLSASQLIAEEVAIHADLNADGIIGAGSTTIESQGNASLLRQSDGLAAVQMGGTLYAVSSPFGLGTGDASSEWQMLAAEAVQGQNQILWRNNPGNFLHLWNLDASWSWQSSSGNFAPSSAAALGLETSFQLDLNGNGLIG